MTGMKLTSDTPILVEHFEPAQRFLRIAVVTETWPPEVNGVAVTLSKLIQHLGKRQHTIQLIRPRQDKHDAGVEQTGWSELLLRGLPIPRYPQLKLGLPSKKALIKAWSVKRPDLVHVATEGPLSWSALQAAQTLRSESQYGLNRGRTAWRCDLCSDADCEHRLFSDLLKPDGLAK